MSPAVGGMLPVLATFAAADSDLLQARALLSRVDRKYVLSERLLPILLEQLRDHYRLLPAAGHMAAAYRTLYFDTVERSMYHDHRRGRCPRIKVRIRHHRDRRLSFLEIKRKQHGARTAKARLELAFGLEELAATVSAFVDEHCSYGSKRLVPCITNEFTRLTLLGARLDERLTIDWGLTVGDGQRVAGFPGAVIVEVKQARYSETSPATRTLRQLRIREGAYSKYCLATARLGDVRSHQFRPALRALELLSA